MRTTACPSDLTGKARIRNAALHLFSVRGYAGTSLRQVASRAQVSLSLVTHHYPSKLMLRRAVQEAALTSIESAVDAALAGASHSADAIALGLSEALADAFVSRPELRGYFRRSLLDPSDDEPTFLERLVVLMQTTLARLCRNGSLSRDASTRARAEQMLLLSLGPLLLDWLATPQSRVAVDRDVLCARSHSGLRALLRELSANARRSSPPPLRSVPAEYATIPHAVQALAAPAL